MISVDIRGVTDTSRAVSAPLRWPQTEGYRGRIQHTLASVRTNERVRVFLPERRYKSLPTAGRRTQSVTSADSPEYTVETSSSHRYGGTHTTPDEATPAEGVYRLPAPAAYRRLAGPTNAIVGTNSTSAPGICSPGRILSRYDQPPPVGTECVSSKSPASVRSVVTVRSLSVDDHSILAASTPVYSTVHPTDCGRDRGSTRRRPRPEVPDGLRLSFGSMSESVADSYEALLDRCRRYSDERRRIGKRPSSRTKCVVRAGGRAVPYTRQSGRISIRPKSDRISAACPLPNSDPLLHQHASALKNSSTPSNSR